MHDDQMVVAWLQDNLLKFSSNMQLNARKRVNLIPSYIPATYLHTTARQGERGALEVWASQIPDLELVGLMIYDGIVGIFIYTKSNVLMHFIDAYITERALHHPRVGLQSAR